MFPSAFPELRFKHALPVVSLTRPNVSKSLYVAARKNVSFLSKISSRLNNAVRADMNRNKTIYLVTDLVRRDLLFKLSFILKNFWLRN